MRLSCHQLMLTWMSCHQMIFDLCALTGGSCLVSRVRRVPDLVLPALSHKNPNTNTHFSAYVGPSWSMLAQSWPILAHVGLCSPQRSPQDRPRRPQVAPSCLKLAPSRLKLGSTWANLGQLGPQESIFLALRGSSWLKVGSTWANLGQLGPQKWISEAL